MKIPLLLASLLLGAFAGKTLSAETSTPAIKTAHFDRDPGWEGYRNRMVPEKIPTVTQDFGYSPTSFASAAPGELGGVVCRASEPAWYGQKIAPHTLDDKLSATGTFALSKSDSSAGICFGWFNGRQASGMGRPTNFLGLILGGTKTGGRLAVQVITARNQVAATFVTKFERYRTKEEIPEMRPTPVRVDGTRYHWKLDYDPAGNDGNGEIQFTVKSESGQPQDFEGKISKVELPAGFKQQGTTFDHFGLINVTRPAGPLTIHFGDLVLNGEAQDLSHDPGWDGAGNRATYQAKEVGGYHDFGYSETSHAGGMPGEIGGLIWRAPYAYYGDPVGPLSLEDPLHARGRFVLMNGAPDSGVFLGWFNSEVRQVDDHAALKGRNFLGVSVGGPTRIGHYFLPEFATARGEHGSLEAGPILQPGKPYEWSLAYDPAASEGHGQIRVTLGEEAATLDLKPGARSKDAVFDRFGIFCVGTGGAQVKIWLDDLQYTATKP